MPQYEIEFCEKDVIRYKCVVEAKSQRQALELIKKRDGKWIQLDHENLGSDDEFFELNYIWKLSKGEHYKLTD